MSRPSYEDIRKQVARRYDRMSLFVFHVIMAVTSIIIIWLIDPTPQDGTPVLAGLWFGVLIFHAVKLWLDNARDREIERAWERYGDNQQGVYDQKSKRMIRLSDEAEQEAYESHLFEPGNHDVSNARR